MFLSLFALEKNICYNLFRARGILMYKIGEFSKIVNMSVRTLRYYDEINILKPGYVDNFSNYRYYTEENINEANLITILRSVGFSLEEILMYKENLNEDAINNKITSLEMEIEDINLKIRKLNIIKEQILDSPLESEEVISLKRKMDSYNKAA